MNDSSSNIDEKTDWEKKFPTKKIELIDEAI